MTHCNRQNIKVTWIGFINYKLNIIISSLSRTDFNHWTLDKDIITLDKSTHNHTSSTLCAGRVVIDELEYNR